MGWETRRNGRTYYYNKKRIEGKVVSRYVGTGPIADLIDKTTELTRLRFEADRQKRQAFRAELEEEAQPVEAFFQQVETLLRQTLEAAGYHRPQRGAWRKKRTGGMTP